MGRIGFRTTRQICKKRNSNCMIMQKLEIEWEKLKGTELKKYRGVCSGKS